MDVSLVKSYNECARGLNQYDFHVDLVKISYTDIMQGICSTRMDIETCVVGILLVHVLRSY